MILPDKRLHALAEVAISPFDPKSVQPSSYDLSLHRDILIPSIQPARIDLRRDNPKDHMFRVEITDEGFVLKPGACVLGSTIEVVACPSDCVARVEGKSSLGRLFLAVHVTAGFIDAGFRGQVTLEIVNHGPWDVVLWPAMKIAQINFALMLEACDRPYGSPGLGSHYQNQGGPTPAVGKRNDQR